MLNLLEHEGTIWEHKQVHTSWPKPARTQCSRMFPRAGQAPSSRVQGHAPHRRAYSSDAPKHHSVHAWSRRFKKWAGRVTPAPPPRMRLTLNSCVHHKQIHGDC